MSGPSDPIRVRSIARGVSEVDPIVLHVSQDETRRLVFLPLIHANPNKDGSVRGRFVYERRRKNDPWNEDWEKVQVPGESLNNLKAGEGYALELRTDELTHLIGSVLRIQEIADAVNEGRTDVTFVPTAQQIAPILQTLVESTPDETLVDELRKLGSEAGLKLNDLVLQARIRRAISFWEKHGTDLDESGWQDFFTQRAWLLTLIFAEPIVILGERMYLGGSTSTGRGGKYVDYALINSQTKNTALVEIKKPATVLLGKQYRGGVYPPSWELAGSVVQVQTYKHELQKNVKDLQDEDLPSFDAFDVPTYVLIGNTEQLEGVAERRSFELFRRGLRGVVILTFDEVFEKLALLAEDQ